MLLPQKHHGLMGYPTRLCAWGPAGCECVTHGWPWRPYDSVKVIAALTHDAQAEPIRIRGSFAMPARRFLNTSCHKMQQELGALTARVAAAI